MWGETAINSINDVAQLANKVNKIKERDNHCGSRYLLYLDSIAVVMEVWENVREANSSESAKHASVFVLSKGVECIGMQPVCLATC